MAPSLDRLQVLEVLLRTRSATETARAIGVTQSAVSKALAQLRAELGDELLVRRGDRMIPTPRAERLADPLSFSLATLRRLFEGELAPARPAAVSIAMRDQFVVVLGAALLRGVARAGAETAVNFTPYERDRLVEDFARGVDLAVAVDPPDAPGLMTRLLYRETLVCVTPHEKPPSLSAYLAARHVATTAHSGYAGIDASLARKGLARRIAARVPYFAALLAIAQSEGLFATVPRRVVETLAPRGLFIHPVPIALAGFPVSMVWDRRSHGDGANQWMRRLVIEAARRPNSTPRS